MLTIEDKRCTILSQKAEIFEMLFSSLYPIYIFGINHESNHLLDVLPRNKININGIIDDYTEHKMYRNYTIKKSNEIEKSAIVISCVIDGKMITVLDKLKKLGVERVLTYFDLRLKFPNIIKEVRFCNNNVIDIETSRKEYDWVYSILNDNLSRETLQQLTDFRYNYNTEAMRFFPFRLEQQYFEDFIKFNANEVFVDCGGFDGVTTQTFIKRVPNYKKIFYFEPSIRQMELSSERLRSYDNISFFNFATFNKNATLKFDDSQGSSSSISDNGDVIVEAVTLDRIINEAVTFMKLDVEGAEYETLQGAENIIRTYKPKLAVCVYHNQSDFWRIPKLLKQYNPDYKIYLRHYTEGLLETVMFFV
ncbi:FkbM family methyltransferase [Paenibacillus sp. FSL W7-1332]|uniref:FkbM family methyltransferase n=1 Tax=Paenibacillus sp. FSL W7-1332 TaxID=2921702 RepID=UPI0030D4B0B2